MLPLSFALPFSLSFSPEGWCSLTTQITGTSLDLATSTLSRTLSKIAGAPATKRTLPGVQKSFCMSTMSRVHFSAILCLVLGSAQQGRRGKQRPGSEKGRGEAKQAREKERGEAKQAREKREGERERREREKREKRVAALETLLSETTEFRLTFFSLCRSTT